MRPALPPVLRHSDFRIFGIGYSISSMGSEFTLLAMAWQMYELTNSPLQVGLIGLARVVPLMSMVLIGGVLADVFDRRRLLMATQVAQFTISAALVVVTVTGSATPLILFCGAAALSLCSALDNPTRVSVVPNLVPQEHLASGMALMQLQTKLGSVIGPSLAGVALAIGGPALCYAADAVSWLALLVALLLVRTSTQTRAVRGVLSLRSIGPGLRYVRAQPVILSIFVLDFGAQLLGTNRALLPVYARDILDVGSTGLGLLIAASSFGAVVTGMLVGLRPPTHRLGVWVLLGVAMYGVCSAVFALSREFWLSLAMMAGVGAGNAMSVVLRGTVSQLDTPDALRGRVASVGSLFTGAGPRLGQTQSGMVAEIIGAPPAAFAGAIATLALTALIGAVTPLRGYEPPKAADVREVVATEGQTEPGLVQPG